MAKKMNYQYGIRKYLVIEVETEEEIVFVKESNRETENEKGRERTYQGKVLSSDMLFDKYEFEFASEDLNPLERLILDERNQMIHEAIKRLTKIQQHIIYEHFWNDKSLRQISRETNKEIKTIRESYHSAMKKLANYLSFLD